MSAQQMRLARRRSPVVRIITAKKEIQVQVRTAIPVLFLTLSLLLLSACESSEERAEKYFQSALSLLEAGDEVRAIVEFRNVFKLNALHQEARTRFAQLQLQRGDVSGAISQYRRLVEQYPDDIDGQLAIAEIFAEIGNWSEMERFVTAANALEPANGRARALRLIYDYRRAIDDGDAAATETAVLASRELLNEQPDNNLLRQVSIDNHVRDANFELALQELDTAIGIAPRDRSLYSVRLAVLAAMLDPFAIEAQLIDLIELFPEDESTRTALVRWYVSQEQLDAAETFLRSAAQQSVADIDSKAALLRFLADFRGSESARLEVNRMIASSLDAPLLRALAAGFEFDLGNRQQALTRMREILAGLDAGEDAQQIMIMQSQMLATSGDLTGAQSMIQAVLEQDGSNVQALKLQATWLISRDRTKEAIAALRTALDQAPRDAAILTLLARAHERNGNRTLVGEMLALALSTAKGAPAEAIRLARFLQQDEKFRAAEDVLISSLRLVPGNLELLAALGDLYIVSGDWPRAEQVQATVGRLSQPEARAMANDLKTRILQGQQKQPEAVAFLERLTDQGGAGFPEQSEIVDSYLTDANPSAARAYVAAQLADSPDDPGLRYLDGAIDAAAGNSEIAERKFQQILEQDDQQIRVWVALFRLQLTTDQPDAANRTVDAARLALPDDQTLKWIKAGLLEADGEPEAAIAIYEDMYAFDSENLIVVNNLASLLSTTRTDAESIQRAITISRRLRTSEFAPYQDTYGWIAYLQGDIPAAINALEPAARVLSEDPTVQYHLAQAYLANRNPAAALAQFQIVLGLTGPADTRDFVLTSRQEAARLSSELANSTSE